MYQSFTIKTDILNRIVVMQLVLFPHGFVFNLNNSWQ